jgi:DNA-binding transcriptional regulator GbsR (MarR family)
MPKVVRFFEESVERLGLSKNAGSVLAVLYAEKYNSGRKLSLEELAKATSYSRSSVTLILSQLKSLGIVQETMDSKQSGRGRRRILYDLEDGVKSPMALLVAQIRACLQDTIGEIEFLLEANKDVSYLNKMLNAFKKETELILRPASKDDVLHIIE